MIFYYEGTHKMHIEIPEWGYANGWQVLPLEGDWDFGGGGLGRWSKCCSAYHVFILCSNLSHDGYAGSMGKTIWSSWVIPMLFFFFHLYILLLYPQPHVHCICRSTDNPMREKKIIYDFQFLFMCTCKHTLHIFQRRGHFCVQLLWHLATIDFEWVC